MSNEGGTRDLAFVPEGVGAPPLVIGRLPQFLSLIMVGRDRGDAPVSPPVGGR